MKGFFTIQQTKSKSRPDGKTYSCASCGLYQYVLSPKMQPTGEFEKGILNLGEGPGQEEDKRGKQWQGKVGRKLKKTYRSVSKIDLFEDCLNINSVNCRTPKNREPSDYEIACCRQENIRVIERYKPKVIVLLGNAAIQSLLGHRWKKDLGGITKWRGWTIPDRDFNAWICPIFHPSYVERNADFPEVETIWEQDIERALGMIDQPLPNFHDEREQVTFLKQQDDINTVLEKINLGWEGYQIAFDYETTGIKPHARGHSIACVSIATAENTYAFMFPTKKRDRVYFERVLANQALGKIAANMKFEQTWTEVRARCNINNWIWDTMQAAHILDNRPGITSLKFQAYVQFGLIDYDSHIEPYLKAKDEKNANSTNRIYDFIDRYGEDELLLYCGIDSLLEYRLAQKQMKELGLQP